MLFPDHKVAMLNRVDIDALYFCLTVICEKYVSSDVAYKSPLLKLSQIIYELYDVDPLVDFPRNVVSYLELHKSVAQLNINPSWGGYLYSMVDSKNITDFWAFKFAAMLFQWCVVWVRLFIFSARRELEVFNKRRFVSGYTRC